MNEASNLNRTFATWQSVGKLGCPTDIDRNVNNNKYIWSIACQCAYIRLKCFNRISRLHFNPISIPLDAFYTRQIDPLFRRWRWVGDDMMRRKEVEGVKETDAGDDETCCWWRVVDVRKIVFCAWRSGAAFYKKTSQAQLSGFQAIDKIYVLHGLGSMPVKLYANMNRPKISFPKFQISEICSTHRFVLQKCQNTIHYYYFI